MGWDACTAFDTVGSGHAMVACEASDLQRIDGNV